MNVRSKAILRSIVREYIRGGAPVGSRTVSRITGMNLSPATMRNIMSDLESMGFLTSPHTSAGRVPSTKGLRFFVDHLIAAHSLDKSITRRLSGEFRGNTADDVLAAAAATVSQLTKFAGFVAAPAREACRIKQLKYVKLSSVRVLTVIVTIDGQVINRIFECDRPPRERDLAAAARFFNRHCAGATFEDAKNRLCEEMGALRAEISSLLSDMISAIDRDMPGAETLRMAGEMNLLEQQELTVDVRRLRNLYQLLNQKKEFFSVIDRGSRADDVCVFIGNECGHEALTDCSLVLSSFGGEEGGGILGYVGVIGPQRMRYRQVITTVDVAAKLVAHSLRQLRLEGPTEDSRQSPL